LRIRPKGTVIHVVDALAGAPEFTAIQHVPGDGSRPASIVTFEGASGDTLEKLVLRLNGMQWKGRSLVVRMLLHTRSPPR